MISGHGAIDCKVRGRFYELHYGLFINRQFPDSDAPRSSVAEIEVYNVRVIRRKQHKTRDITKMLSNELYWEFCDKILQSMEPSK